MLIVVTSLSRTPGEGNYGGQFKIIYGTEFTLKSSEHKKKKKKINYNQKESNPVPKYLRGPRF